MRSRSLIGLTLSLVSGALCAHPLDGDWTTLDDETGRANSVVRIEERSGQITARVIRILDVEKAGRFCAACSDDRKNQPIQGMQVVRGVAAQAVAPGTWRGGTILDPKSGKTYDVQLKLVEQAKALEVRGYLGFAMLGRTQRWLRASYEATQP
jgi:uncharacterized protein (DUF2147 family)